MQNAWGFYKAITFSWRQLDYFIVVEEDPLNIFSNKLQVITVYVGLQAMQRKCDRAFVSTRNVAGILLCGRKDGVWEMEVPQSAPEADRRLGLGAKPLEARDSHRKYEEWK